MKIYIKVPFNEKDEVKKLSGRWDTEVKSWYIPEGEDENKFSKWERHDPSVRVESNATRIYLNVPFAEKDEARAATARWDGDKKQWYYLSDQDSSLFSKWFSAEQPTQNNVNKIQKTNNKNVQSNNHGDDDLSSDLDAILSLDNE